MRAKLNTSIRKYLNLLIRFLYKLEKQLMSNDINDRNDSSYSDLTPQNDIDGKEYFRALNYALDNDNVTNIAVTGPYGSGKSSVLRTYEKKEESKKFKFLNVSLASFKLDQNDTQTIESSILQQMFYRESSKNISGSRFKRINKIRLRETLFALLIVLSACISGLYILNPEFIEIRLGNLFYTMENGINVAGLSMFIIFLTALSIIFHKGYKLVKYNLRLNKVNIKNWEFTSHNKEDSILNKYLDEIIYFFESTKYDVVIFEDLDRFNNEDIFTKLREINNLLNNSDKIAKKIVFLYAVKDEMFTNNDYKNKTKFFDFIIPIVPIVNASNSYEILKDKINDKVHESEDKPTERCIREVSVFIEDMRTLINISNEFILYHRILGEMQLNSDRLLGIITYKNVYPKDFAELLLDRGMIYTAFQRKQKFVQKQVSDFQKKQSEIEDRITQINSEQIKNIEELQTIYLSALQRKNNDQSNILVDGTNRNIWNYEGEKEQQFLNELTNATVIKGANNRHKIPFDGIKTAFGKKENYYDRERKILDKTKIDQLREKIEQLNLEKERVRKLPLQDLLNNDDSFEVLEEIKENKLLVFLLRRGYIDERYQDYITYFYPGSVTKNDMIFIRSVYNRIGSEFNHKLTNIREVIESLHNNDFERKEVLNYDLVSYIIKNRYQNNYRFKAIIKQLVDGSDASFIFIDGLLTKANNKVIWNELLERELLKYIIDESYFSITKTYSYLIDIFLHADISIIESVNYDSKLTNYISSTENFLDLIDEGLHENQYLSGEAGDETPQINYSRIKEAIKVLDVEFKLLNNPKNKFSSEMLFYIYNNNLYDLNVDMIGVMLDHIGDITNNQLNDLRKSNYTIIQESNCDQMKDYIMENIEEYIENVVIELKSNVEESEYVLVELLNNPNINNYHKEEMIKSQKRDIEMVTKVEDQEMWNMLVDNSKLIPSWFNVIRYYQYTKDINESLINFLNESKNYQQLSKIDIDADQEIEDNEIKEFVGELLFCEDISVESFRCLIKSITWDYEDLDTEGLSTYKVIDLIKNDVMTLTPANFSNLKKLNAPHHITLVGNNIDNFMSNPLKYDLAPEDVEHLLKSEVMNNISKVNLLEMYTESNSSNQIEEIFSTEYTTDLILALMESSISKEILVLILIQQVDILDINDLTSSLNSLGEPYSLITVFGKKPAIVNNEVNQNLMTVLKQHDYILSWKEENSDKIRVQNKKGGKVKK
ncbi:hypothetical protein [Salicibibacter kimchii]|uniref:YobI-like P-loop NTPase domain-containing protein n=1 Tax=Salicibibacter kimchii TaxID=2099786 RepID=A0A345BWE7_9BACI|nr:hypothetical protein [Salicibibacter kimchii]AXF55278.1 hypothetical protein DT065_04080 [Salicibibacter kimchii]